MEINCFNVIFKDSRKQFICYIYITSYLLRPSISTRTISIHPGVGEFLFCVYGDDLSGQSTLERFIYVHVHVLPSSAAVLPSPS